MFGLILHSLTCDVDGISNFNDNLFFIISDLYCYLLSIIDKLNKLQ